MAFESAARHQSFTQAARELTLTQSAICRQIAGLEEFLGVSLFHRTKRGVTLTEAGIIYGRQVALCLDAIERDTLELMARRGLGGNLELAIVPTFASKWLMPRLARFHKIHPDISINLTTRTRPFLFNETGFDAAIHCGDANWPGTEACFLMQEDIVPVCSPGLIAPRQNLGPQQVQEYPLLQQTTRPYAWHTWFESFELQVEHDMTGPRYELFSMLTQAAIHSMGIALIPRFLIEIELKTGQLIVPVDHYFVNNKSYYLVYPEEQAESAVLKQFRVWLENEAESYRQGIGQK